MYMERRKVAEREQELLANSYRKQKLREESVEGLVIHKALYGRHNIIAHPPRIINRQHPYYNKTLLQQGCDYSVSEVVKCQDTWILDATIAIGSKVRNSELHISSQQKSRLSGLCYPTSPLLGWRIPPPKLRIIYSHRGKEHDRTFDDTEGICIT
eukprot:GHVQ01036812.1.p1 GENE.GHVQ01036812.1~~GHVQ01036812.1.p1  ORF type:complete len:155 (-),score=16.70 GHVQ01036812.1:643-1107(-)